MVTPSVTRPGTSISRVMETRLSEFVSAMRTSVTVSYADDLPGRFEWVCAHQFRKGALILYYLAPPRSQKLEPGRFQCRPVGRFSLGCKAQISFPGWRVHRFLKDAIKKATGPFPVAAPFREASRFGERARTPLGGVRGSSFFGPRCLRLRSRPFAGASPP